MVANARYRRTAHPLAAHFRDHTYVGPEAGGAEALRDAT